MRIQFETAKDVFLAYPTLADDLVAGPSDQPPLDYLARLLETETPEDAITFFGYLAPKREAVWWACRCVRLLGIERANGEGVHLAERWVKQPEEENQRAAWAYAEAHDSGLADTWTAYGAGWSGGNIAPEGSHPVLAAPELTAKAVRAAVIIAICDGDWKLRRERLKRCYDEAMRIARDDMEAELG